MGDFRVVRGGDSGFLRTVKITSAATIEEGDLLVESAGTFGLAASNCILAAGIAIEDIASGDTGMMAVLTPNLIIEGTGVSTHLQGDPAGIVVSGDMSFDEDASNIFGNVYKIVDSTTYKIQVRPLAAVCQM